MEYKVEYSKRRSISISVKDGNLNVKAPYKATEEDILRILKKHSRWIENHLEYARKSNKLETSLDSDAVKKLKREAREYLLPMVEKYSKIMDIKYGRVAITSAKTRFGSCSSKGNISLSYRLMLYPESAREYVVVHELAHIVHMDHSDKFYALIEKYLPDYKDRKKQLKRIPSV